MTDTPTAHVFAPGCALSIYKPHLAEKLHRFLDEELGGVALHETCCRHEAGLKAGTRVVNVCAGCDRRYREENPGLDTVSLWEVLARSERFAFPDLGDVRMAVHDACPTRTEDRVHEAVRALLSRMNVQVVEPSATRGNAVCCGDSLFGLTDDERVLGAMRKRAASMPADDVVVYCVSCIKAMHNGGKRPRYLVDLLFAEQTDAGETDPAAWHAELDRYIEQH